MPRNLISNLLGLLAAIIGGGRGILHFPMALGARLLRPHDSRAPFWGCGAVYRRGTLLVAGESRAASPRSASRFSPSGISRSSRTILVSAFPHACEGLESGHAPDDRNRIAHRSLATAKTADFAVIRDPAPSALSTRPARRTTRAGDKPPNPGARSGRSSSSPSFAESHGTILQDGPARYVITTQGRIASHAGSTTVQDRRGIIASRNRFSKPKSCSFRAVCGLVSRRHCFAVNFAVTRFFLFPELTETERPTASREAGGGASHKTISDAAAIDRDADIHPSVIQGLADLGVLGMAAPKEWGGRAFSQMGYCPGSWK